MKYILTTTKKWGKPLETAEFIIKLPASYKLKHISFDYDRHTKSDEYNIYRIIKNNFMPDQNLVIIWKDQ